MKGIVSIFVVVIGLRLAMTGFRSQSYSINYRIQDRIVPVRIEFDNNRQVEYVMNLHSDGNGKSVTLYDFNQNMVIYKELTARECYITRLTDETLEKERAQLQKKKDSILDSSVEITLYADNILSSVTEIQKIAGSRAARFCKGMASYLIGGARRRRYRSKRETEPFLQRSYGHYGQQTVNYSHYGHETYTLGSFGDKLLQVLQNGTYGKTKAGPVGYPIFILLPLSGQFGVKTTHSGGYQLHLPVGQANANYSGGINSEENQISQLKKDNVKGHSWNTFQRISNSTDFPAMVIIPGMPHMNMSDGLQAIPLQRLPSQQRSDRAMTSAFVSTALNNNNKVIGKSEVENHKISLSGDSKEQGTFNAKSDYVSNVSMLNSRITGGPRGADASISASVFGKGSSSSKVATQAQEGKSYSDSNLDFAHGKVSSRAEGSQQNADAKSRASGDLTSTNTKSDIIALQNNVHLLEANASTSHRNKSGKAKATVRNVYPSSTSTSNAFGSYAGRHSGRHKGISTKEANVFNDMDSTNTLGFSPLYSTQIISPFQREVYTHSATKPKNFHRHPSAINQPKHSKFNYHTAKKNHGQASHTYPTVLVENVAYPLMFPKAKKRNSTELKFSKPPQKKIPSIYVHHNGTAISSRVPKKPDMQRNRKNISSQSNNLVKRRNYFDVTFNKLPRSKYVSRSNQTINKFKSRFPVRSSNEVAYSKRDHKGLFGRNRLNRYRPSNVTGAHETQLRKEQSPYNVKHSVAPKRTGKRCCSLRHVLTRKKTELRSTGSGCCSRVIYSIIPDQTKLTNEKNCKPTCYFVFRTTERIRICRMDNLSTC